MLYGDAGRAGAYGLDVGEVVAKLHSNFSFVASSRSSLPSVSNLSSTLNSKLIHTRDSAIITGTLKDQSKFKAHAFNAIKNQDGKWEFLDLQNGVMYNEKAMEKTFSSYEIFDVK